MYYDELIASQREREVAARTRAPLFAQEPAGGPLWPDRNLRAARRRRNRSERGRSGISLPRLSLGKWRHWAAKPDSVHCSRAAAASGAC